MRVKLDEMTRQALLELEDCRNAADAQQLKVKYLGKKGDLTALLRSLGTLAPEERPQMGQMINESVRRVESLIDEKIESMKGGERQRRMASESIDVTKPGKRFKRGSMHPISIVQKRIIDIFTGMGFTVAEGPEIELDYYNFELMNTPKNHPARDAQDTFYFSENILLRTHTSPVQARTMLSQKPPIRIICPGRVYRADELDATHSPVFYQVEGLVIDRNITMAHLKGTLDMFARGMFGNGASTRFRPSFFPFTEPSAEVDATCAACMGKGCRVCKGVGWVEILGAGMVDPNVLEMCGIDPNIYSGFAFGMGIERTANIRYNTDVRSLYENDARFIEQFKTEGGL